MIIEFLGDLHPVVQALLATIFTWGVTALGAAAVFLTKEISRRLLDAMLGFAAGVMISASYWSLLNPAVELSGDIFSYPSWVPTTVGFLAGGAFLAVADKFIPRFQPESTKHGDKDKQDTWRRSFLLVLAVTIHNFPEGMAVGVAFGAAANGVGSASIGSAVALAIGIGLQNFPEGMVISMPLRREGVSAGRSFFYGQLSAVVEPIAGVLGAALVLLMRPVLPYALAFAAGAMIYVVVKELVPESETGRNAGLASLGVMLGFSVMMVLDLALG